MILGVGGFSTDDILNQGLTNAQVSKEVGPVVVKLKIKASKLGINQKPKFEK